MDADAGGIAIALLHKSADTLKKYGYTSPFKKRYDNMSSLTKGMITCHPLTKKAKTFGIKAIHE